MEYFHTCALRQPATELLQEDLRFARASLTCRLLRPRQVKAQVNLYFESMGSKGKGSGGRGKGRGRDGSPDGGGGGGGGNCYNCGSVDDESPLLPLRAMVSWVLPLQLGVDAAAPSSPNFDLSSHVFAVSQGTGSSVPRLLGAAAGGRWWRRRRWRQLLQLRVSRCHRRRRCEIYAGDLFS